MLRLKICTTSFSSMNAKFVLYLLELILHAVLNLPQIWLLLARAWFLRLVPNYYFLREFSARYSSQNAACFCLENPLRVFIKGRKYLAVVVEYSTTTSFFTLCRRKNSGSAPIVGLKTFYSFVSRQLSTTKNSWGMSIVCSCTLYWSSSI